MSAPYPLNTARYSVASILAAYGAMTFHAVVDKAKDKHTMAEVRAALAGLRRADLAEQNEADQRWKLTTSGKKHWRAQHAPAPEASQPDVVRGRPGDSVAPIFHPAELLTRGMIRLSSPANRLPMVYRPGSMDSANLPRICGSLRVWPDGRSEPVCTPPAKDAA